MELKLFYRTQRELAIAINELIDGYHNGSVDEGILIESIKSMNRNNPYKLVKNNHFTTVVQQQCGKRRLEIVEQIIRNEKQVEER